ncbi:MAG: hypothetical protein AAFZ52_04260, partial [Bacteroidota bacterium]
MSRKRRVQQRSGRSKYLTGFVRLLLDGKKSDLSGAAQKALRKARFRADVEFIPSLPPDEARKVFASARALLYPSLS